MSDDHPRSDEYPIDMSLAGFYFCNNQLWICFLDHFIGSGRLDVKLTLVYLVNHAEIDTLDPENMLE